MKAALRRVGLLWVAFCGAASCHERAPVAAPVDSAPMADEDAGAAAQLPTLVAIEGGDRHMCVLDSAASVRCWGDNTYGQLGYGHREAISEAEAQTRSTPVQLGGRVVQLSVGGYHSCALLEGGAVRCWGDNRAGQVNAAWPKVVETPTELRHSRFGGILRYASLEAMRRRYAWDAGSVAPIVAVGDDEVPAATWPVPLGVPVVEVASGAFHSCARTVGGRVFCWGWLDGPEPQPVHEVVMPRPAVEVVAGKLFSCVRFGDGGIRCWGENHPGRDESCTRHECHVERAALDRSVPLNRARLWGFGRLGYLAIKQVSGEQVAHHFDVGEDFGPWTEPGPFPRDFVKLYPGDHHVCGLRGGGAVACWGDLGFESGVETVPGLGDYKVGWGHVAFFGGEEQVKRGYAQAPAARILAAAGADICALDACRQVRCWKGTHSDVAERLPLTGQGTPRHSWDGEPPPPVALGEPARALALQVDRGCAILVSGRVTCWGREGDWRSFRLPGIGKGAGRALELPRDPQCDEPKPG